MVWQKRCSSSSVNVVYAAAASFANEAAKGHLVGQRVGVQHAVTVEDLLLLDRALAFELAGVVYRGVEVLEQVCVDGGEHVGRKEERAAREQLGDSLAYQVGFLAFAVCVGAGVSFANKFTNFVEPFFTADVGISLVAQVVGYLQAVAVLQADGDGPVVPATLFRSVFGSRSIFEIVVVVCGHNGYLGSPRSA